MSQSLTPSAWCAQVQAKLMAALDAAWAVVDTSDDPVEIAKARAKARVCGQLASDARKIATMVPQPKTPESKPRHLPAAIHEAFDRLDAATAPLIAEAARQQAHDAGKPPAAQALAMQAALKKLKRR
jgi:hypothetical protein